MLIGLVGNPNSGKTTLFNSLTGMNLKVGNWPGVTIEKKEGIVKGTKHVIVDLPGIYSLSPYTTEEIVSRNFIFKEKPDIIINIIDASRLERSLYLTTQLLELDCKVIVVLNMVDILLKQGILIDVNRLGNMLGAKVVEISALKGTGIDNLIASIDESTSFQSDLIYDANIENAIFKIENSLEKTLLNKRFISVKLLERDEDFKGLISPSSASILTNLEKKYDADLEEIIASQRYIYIEKLKDSCLFKESKKENLSDKLDKFFLNKWISFPIFSLIMFFIYYLSAGVVGSYTASLVNNVANIIGIHIANKLQYIGVSKWIISLIVDGIITGVGSVLSFVPELTILFACISLLEATGYMSRISLLLDRIFKKIGLSGKSLIPFIVGSGCSVPGIMASRILENDDERKIVSILTPFIPCSAKLPIIVLFSSCFFKENSGLVATSLYFLAIVIIILSSYIMKKYIYTSSWNSYVSELPDYKFPNVRYVFKDVCDKVFSFIKRAGTVILLCSIAVWFLLSFSINLNYVENIENSILAFIGQKISWVFYPFLGANSWEATVSAIQGLVAKEQVISSMAVISGLSKDITSGNELFNRQYFWFFY